MPLHVLARSRPPLVLTLLFAALLIASCGGEPSAQSQRDHITPATALAGASGDFRPGVLARDASGALWFYPGDGKGGFLARATAGSGWNGMDLIVGAEDFDGDGHPDLLAREAATSKLWLYSGNGAGGFNAWRVVGTGWAGMVDVIGAGDIDGDRNADVVARDTSGRVWLYPGNGSGGFLARRELSADFSGLNLLIAAGDFDGDGHPDLIGRTTRGALLLYSGTGGGGVYQPATIGASWNGMSTILGAGDFNGDGKADLLAREASSGALWLYPGAGGGAFGSRLQVGTGWNGMTALAVATTSFSSGSSRFPGGTGNLVATSGSFILTFSSLAPALPATTANNLIRALLTTMPKECARFNPSCPKKVLMVVDPRYKGPAATANAVITVGAEYIEKAPLDYDVATHEAMHIVQDYPGTSAPDYWVEGLADYARYTYGIGNADAGWSLPAVAAGQSYTDSYRITARFLVWLERHVDSSLPVALDQALRSNVYSDQFWIDETGQTIGQLWAAYVRSPAL